MMKRSSTMIWVVGAWLTLGCSKSSEEREAEMARSDADRATSSPKSESLTPASATRPAAERIARARCDREQRCGNVGPKETYSSAQDCLTRVQADWRDDLNARECPGGVNAQQLDECLAQIRSEACGNPFDTLARVTECTSAQICIEEIQ